MLVTPDGEPHDLAVLVTAVPNWSVGEVSHSATGSSSASCTSTSSSTSTRSTCCTSKASTACGSSSRLEPFSSAVACSSGGSGRRTRRRPSSALYQWPPWLQAGLRSPADSAMCRCCRDNWGRSLKTRFLLLATAILSFVCAHATRTLRADLPRRMARTGSRAARAHRGRTAERRGHPLRSTRAGS